MITGKYSGQQYQVLTFNNDAAPITLFTVTGVVEVDILCSCSLNLASGAAGNIEVGIAANPAAIIATTLATNIIATEIWHDATPDSEIEAQTDAWRRFVITGGNDIILTPSAQIDSGILIFWCRWAGISSLSGVVAA